MDEEQLEKRAYQIGYATGKAEVREELRELLDEELISLSDVLETLKEKLNDW